MRKFLFLPFFIFSLNIQCQDKDLFITYNDTTLFNKVKSKTDIKTVEVYIISFKTVESPKYKFFLNDKEELMKNIQFPTVQGGSLTFLYEKEKDFDIKVSLNKMKYLIKCNEIIYARETDFEDFFSKFKNIYFVDVSKNKAKYLAKKIKVIINKGM